MTYEFTYMLHLAGCGALGCAPQPPAQPVDWERVLAFANEQTVLPLVQYAMGKAAFSIPEDHRSHVVSAMRSMAYVGVVRRTGVLKILKECADEGLEVAVIKGFAIAREYAVPDVRISCDTDLWIKESDEDRVLEIFQRNGFQGEKRTSQEKDTVLTHPKFGVVELHVQLFEKFISKIWYQGYEFTPKEALRIVTDPDGAYCTLGVTDHFLFVLQHMMKHFIVDGLSLRMILDVGVLLRAHMDILDHERVAAVLDECKYTRAMQGLMSVLHNFCGFSFGGCPWLGGMLPAEDEAVRMVLHDMEYGGVRGFKEDRRERLDGMRVYNAALKKKQMGPVRFWFYLRVQKLCTLLRIAFPSMEIMKRKYACVRKAPALYPAAWVHRAFSRGIYYKRIHNDWMRNAQVLLDEDSVRESGGTERMEIFRALDML